MRRAITIAGMSAMIGLALTTASFAVNCDALVEDGAGVISDISKVETAARALGNTGPTVRIRTANLNGQDPASYARGLRDQCPAWQAGPNVWRNNMLVLVYAPNQSTDLAVQYGASNASKLGDGKWQRALTVHLVPTIKAYRAGQKDAITQGLVFALNEFQGAVARPALATGNNTTVIHQASDNSGLYKFLILFLILGGAGVGFYFYRQWAADKGNVSAAQQEAKRVRSIVVTGILNMTDATTLALLQSYITNAAASKQKKLQLLYDQYVKLGQSANRALSTFDSTSDEDPNARLSEEAYRSNQSRYEEINAKYIQPAEDLAADIKAGNVSTPGIGNTIRHSSHAQNSSAPSSSAWSPATPAAPATQAAPAAPAAPATAAGGTTIIERTEYRDNSPVFIPVPIVIPGRDHYYEPEPHYEAPSRRHSRDEDAPSRDTGGSFGSGSSKNDDEGGSFASSSASSSDSGSDFSSSDSSSSDSGGSMSSDD